MPAPATLRAGTGEILTITGSGFGATQGTGKVQFDNADDPIAPDRFVAAAALDYVSWTDTQIRVKVPDKGVKNTGTFATPGSGPIRVITASGSILTTATALNIEYAVAGGTNAAGQKVRLGLAHFQCKIPLLFTLHQNVASIPDAVTNIEAALLAWRQRLGIDVKLEKLANGQPVTVTGNVAGKNVIYFDPAWVRGMITAGSYGQVPSRLPGETTSVERPFMADADIRIAQTITDNSGNTYQWDYSPPGTNIPAGTSSFYDAFLHEVGHALGVNHILDLANPGQELMYWTLGVATLSANRPTLTSSGGSSASAAENIVAYSKTLTWFPPTPATQNVRTLVNSTMSSPVITASGPTTFNVGGSVTLTSSSATGNVWAPGGATTQSITVTNSGTYSLTVRDGTDPNACSFLATPVVVTVRKVTVGTIAPATYCAGASVAVPFTVESPFPIGNIFTAQLSNATGSFASPMTIGSLPGSASGTINATIPSTSATGTGYRIRIVASNPALTSVDNGVNLTINSLKPASITIATPSTSVCAGTLMPVTWTSVVGCTVTGNSVTKPGAWDAGVASTQVVNNGGYVEATVAETNTFRFLGLSRTNTDAGYTSIQYGIDLTNAGAIAIYESGVSRGMFGSYVTGDKVKIAVENNVVKYYKNTTLLYTSTVAPALPLLVDLSFYSTGATMNQVNIFNTATTLTFTATATNPGTSPVYQWKVNGANVGTNNPVFTSTTLKAGNVVTCQLTSNAPCAVSQATSNNITVTGGNCRTGEKLADTKTVREANALLVVFPNPTTSDFTIVLPATATEVTSVIVIRDMTGRIVRQISTHDMHATVSTTGLGTGLYLIQVKQGQHVLSGKVQIIK